MDIHHHYIVPQPPMDMAPQFNMAQTNFMQPFQQQPVQLPLPMPQPPMNIPPQFSMNFIQPVQQHVQLPQPVPQFLQQQPQIHPEPTYDYEGVSQHHIGSSWNKRKPTPYGKEAKENTSDDAGGKGSSWNKRKPTPYGKEAKENTSDDAGGKAAMCIKIITCIMLFMKLVVGLVYINDCPAENRIPALLVGLVAVEGVVDVIECYVTSCDKRAKYIRILLVKHFIITVVGSIVTFHNYSYLSGGCDGADECCNENFLKFALSFAIIDWMCISSFICIKLICWWKGCSDKENKDENNHGIANISDSTATTNPAFSHQHTESAERRAIALHYSNGPGRTHTDEEYENSSFSLCI